MKILITNKNSKISFVHELPEYGDDTDTEKAASNFANAIGSKQWVRIGSTIYFFSDISRIEFKV